MAPSWSGLSWSLGLEAKPLAGIQGQNSRKLLGLNHIKEQNQHSASPLFFFWGFFSSIFLIFSAIRMFFWERRSRGFRSPDRECNKNNAHVLLSRILSIINSDWLQHGRSVRRCRVYQGPEAIYFFSVPLFGLRIFLLISIFHFENLSKCITFSNEDVRRIDPRPIIINQLPNH